MFQTFTGSSRRPRQVNLSGRNSNPFAILQQPSASGQNAQSSAVQHAQQERKARQYERDRQQATRTIQKAWKSHATRKKRRNEQRLLWDQMIERTNPDLQESIHLLLQFVRPRQEDDDYQRILSACRVFFTRDVEHHEQQTASPKDMAKFGAELAGMLEIIIERKMLEDVQVVLPALQKVTVTWPEQSAVYSTRIFRSITLLLTSPIKDSIFDRSYSLIMGLLQLSGSQVILAHEGLCGMMGHEWMRKTFDLKHLATLLDARSLTFALQNYLKTWKPSIHENASCMLAQYIFLYRHADGARPDRTRLQNNRQQVETSVRERTSAGEAIAHIDSLTKLMSMMTRDHRLSSAGDDHSERFDGFVRDELETLVDQDTISSLLTYFEASSSNTTQTEFASTLSSYVLTLIQLFPRRNDEIRMWIYMGSANAEVDGHMQKLPALKFFWEAVKQTDIFRRISQGPTYAVELITVQKRNMLSETAQLSQQQEWKSCLLFLELYTFVLKIMDDDEFMSVEASDTGYQSWTRQSALSLDAVRDLTVFLKSLAFTMYWHASEITSGDKNVLSSTLRHYFNSPDVNRPAISRVRDSDFLVVNGLQSSSISYLKGTATGLLRMLYERDSRRHFCDEGFWLMPEVEMAGFIQAVLEEQKHKDEQGDQDDSNDEDDLMEVDDEFDDRDLRSLVGAQRTQYLHRVEQIRRQQQRAIKRRRLEDSLPRLNILENMPFFIPFHTRVQIFRELVNSDRATVRYGRLNHPSLMSGRGSIDFDEFPEAAGSARVRRGHVMDDAFRQLYNVGEGLKRALQITFVDQFNAPEAGIDGGGVTKEFLNSIIEEAFKKKDSRLFKENSQHLLYPNPVLIEEEKAMLRQEGVSENGKAWQGHIREVLLRYEFLGRIVGKCLYDGILIDVHFAPFFLVKWALTGGRGSATNESAYRANINDLKALDEELYRGLLNLKNYPGNAEDFSLDFTITDEISTEDEPLGSLKITKELRPDGASIPVTNENKLVYISYVARHRLQLQAQQQTNAFLRGVGTMIQPSWLSMFNQSELQTLIGGDSSEIDIPDLRRNTVYGGVYEIGDDGQEHPTVKLFWEVVQGLSDSDRRKFLKYVTSTPRAPLLGFNQLRPLFSIRDSGGDQQRLPSTSTCVNLLKLPIYKDKAVLREKLLYAITSGAGFDLS